MSHDGKRKISLEDLLQMKRAELPRAEFWVHFDEQLRAKQLAALVQRRPWWRRVTDWAYVVSAFRLLRVPLGAAAVLALSLVTVGDSFWRPESVSFITDPVAPLIAEPEEVTEVQAPKGLRRNEVAVRPESVVNEPAEFEEHRANVVAPASATRVPPESLHHSGGAGWASLLAQSPLSSDATPSSRSIAANLIAAGEVEPELVKNLMGALRRPEHSAAAIRTAVDPLQQMTPPSEVRLARYRSPLVASNLSENGDRTGERVARRLSDDRLYDQINRFGARGDRLHVRF